MSAFFDTLLRLSGWPVYAVTAAVIFGETALFVGLVLPGETVLVLASVLAARGNISWWLLGVVAIVAAVGGDTTGYLLGRRLGPHLEASRLGRRRSPERWAQAHDRIATRGARAVLTGRWVGFVRSFVPWLAGMGLMPFRPFIVADLIGVSSWVGACIALGFVAHGSFQRAQALASDAAIAIVALVVAAVVVTVLVRRKHASQT
ncbi:MAG: DedA family protein [Nostocoides sp.]